MLRIWGRPEKFAPSKNILEAGADTGVERVEARC